MDYYMDIVIKKQDIEKIGLKEMYFEWSGEDHSYKPTRYATNDHIEFEQIENSYDIFDSFGITLEKEYIGLGLKSDLLQELEYFVNSEAKELIANSLLEFLEGMTRLSFFYVFLIREDEDIKESYEIITEKEMREKVFECMNWSTPKDVVLFKNIE